MPRVGAAQLGSKVTGRKDADPLASPCTGPVAFDVTRARCHGPDRFPRFCVRRAGTPLAEAGLPAATPLLVFERGGERRALLVRQMTWHHVAQGELAGQPYVVVF